MAAGADAECFLLGSGGLEVGLEAGWGYHPPGSIPGHPLPVARTLLLQALDPPKLVPPAGDQVLQTLTDEKGPRWQLALLSDSGHHPENAVMWVHVHLHLVRKWSGDAYSQFQ